MTTAAQYLAALPGVTLVRSDGNEHTLVLTDGTTRAPTEVELVLANRAAIRPVTRRQMLTALHRSGLLTQIDAAVAASGDIEVQIAYKESQEFQRANPFLAQMAAALGFTDEQIDDVFALAATL